MEHPQLLALLDNLPLFHRDLARTHLRHADKEQSDQPDLGIIRFNEDRASCSCRRDVALARALAHRVCGFSFREVIIQRLAVVCPRDDIGFDDFARNGRVPAVIAQRGEEGLVDCATDEMWSQRVSGQHVQNTVGLPFHPEAVAGFHVVRDGIRQTLTCIRDDAVVLWARDGAYAIVEAESARKEVVPRFEAVMLGLRIADEEFFKLVRCLSAQVGGEFEMLQRCRGEPAVWVTAET